MIQSDWIILLRFDDSHTHEEVINYLDTVLDFEELKGYEVIG
jgi:hypothetical protein